MRYFFVLIIFLYAPLSAADINDAKGVEIHAYEIKAIEDVQAKKSMQKWLDGDFGLRPYKVNYLLPYGFRKEGEYKSYVETDEYKSYEAELQLSFKLYLGTNLLGLNESYYLAYSHKAFWQIYAYSSPFRETIYNPEAFVVFPITGDESIFNITSAKIALAHRSNGQGSDANSAYAIPSQNPQNRSRSLNYLYTEFSFQHDTLVTELTLWARFPEKIQSDDNPDIMDYTGFASLKFNYFVYKNMFTLMGRGNIKKGNGAVEATYSYPMIDNAYFYAKIFSGYGESLIDYNNYITKFSIGFSFSR